MLTLRISVYAGILHWSIQVYRQGQCRTEAHNQTNGSRFSTLSNQYPHSVDVDSPY